MENNTLNRTIPDEYLKQWQRTVDLMARLFEVPAGLIMRLLPSELEVMVASNTTGNPYEPKERAKLNTGLYCEAVIKTRTHLQVQNALKDPLWMNNPDICLGMISYVGFPLIWPDNEIFGTICVLDRKPRQFSKTYLSLLWQFKDMIEADLKLILNNQNLTEEIGKRITIENELQKLNEQLEMRLEELESFSYTVSHDLKSPLNHIVAYADLLILGHENLDEKIFNSLEEIKNECFKASDMIAAILKLSHISKSELMISTVNLSFIAENILDALQKSQPSRNVQIDIQPDIVVSGDHDLLLDLMENLLGNAWKYTEKTPDAKIEFYSVKDIETGEALYCVKDNGIGFNMQHAGKLFQPFVRLHKTEEFKGTGVGLATAKRIIKSHRGRIKAESALGKGALFSFTLGV